MEQIPVLVDELGVARLQNAVYVGLMKFTLDQMNNQFDEGNPAPGKLGRQLTSYTAAYNVLNNAYALQMKRMETAGIAALDTEGDQLIYGVKGMLEATLRMAYDQERMHKAQVFNEFVRKYRLDPTENMLAEWSKVQQMTEEWAGNAHLRMCGEALGLNGPMTRLQEIADEIEGCVHQDQGKGHCKRLIIAEKGSEHLLYPRRFHGFHPLFGYVQDKNQF